MKSLKHYINQVPEERAVNGEWCRLVSASINTAPLARQGCIGTLDVEYKGERESSAQFLPITKDHNVIL
jgi:hypothetical protein